MVRPEPRGAKGSQGEPREAQTPQMEREGSKEVEAMPVAAKSRSRGECHWWREQWAVVLIVRNSGNLALPLSLSSPLTKLLRQEF